MCMWSLVGKSIIIRLVFGTMSDFPVLTDWFFEIFTVSRFHPPWLITATTVAAAVDIFDDESKCLHLVPLSFFHDFHERDWLNSSKIIAETLSLKQILWNHCQGSLALLSTRGIKISTCSGSRAMKHMSRTVNEKEKKTYHSISKKNTALNGCNSTHVGFLTAGNEACVSSDFFLQSA